MTIQNSLYSTILNNGISEIQCRYIAFKLETFGVKKILEISKNNDHYIFKTDVKNYKIQPLNIDIPSTPISEL